MFLNFLQKHFLALSMFEKFQFAAFYFTFLNDLRNKNCNGNVKIILTTSGQTSEEKALNKSCLHFFFFNINKH